MRRWGTITLVLFAFLIGFVSTYNCGGGSSAEAAGDADTLQGHPASDFALSSHQHDAGDITSGVLSISLLPAHTHDAGDLVTGTVPTGRLSGTYDINITGNAETATDATNAGTLDGMDSSEFALSTHAHPELTPGVYPIGAPAFTPSFHGPLSLSGKGGYFEVTDISIKALAPISIPFQCTIVGMEAKIKKRDTNEDIVVELNDGTENELDELIPITTLDTSGWAATDQSTIINSEAISYSYDPVTLVSPLFIRVIFNDVSPNLRFYWVKIYYTIP